MSLNTLIFSLPDADQRKAVASTGEPWKTVKMWHFFRVFTGSAVAQW